MTEIGLDDTDRRLIQLLRADARLPAATLAKHLGVSRGTVQNRIERLRSAGVLLGSLFACAAMSLLRLSAPSPPWRSGQRTRRR
jgi:hypothetical protein